MIKLYDTRRRQKVDFEPVEPGKVSMYVCGPTVYNRIHIGNARTFISFDMIRRYLSWRGFDVTFVQNVTDVDDKIIRRAAEEARTAAEVAEEYTRLFIEDMHAADVQDPDIRPKATEEIGTMIALIERLIERGHAYVSEGDVYFDVRSYPGYGQLSGRDVDEAESGHRELRADGQGLEERKRDELDFALWRPSPASRRGNPPGARAVRAGTSSARPCPRSTWGYPSTSTAAGPIWCSRTTRTSAPSPSAPATARSPTTGCTPACCKSPTPRPARPRRCRSR